MNSNCSRLDTVEVIGSTGSHYTVRFTALGLTCTCRGFHYRDACKHLDQARTARCTWRAGDEPETIPGACPRCGAATTTPVTDRAGADRPAITVTIFISDDGRFTAGPLGHHPLAYAYRVRRRTDSPIVCPSCLPLAAPTALDITPLTEVELPVHDAGSCESCSRRLTPADHVYAARLPLRIM